MKATILKLGFFLLLLTTVSTSKSLAYTAVTDGDWTNPATWGGVAPSGTVSNQDIIIPSGIDVILNTDVTFSGLLNNFTVDGTLSSTTDKQLTIQLGTFGGNGDIDIERIVFDGILVSYSHTGDLTVGSFVNMGSALVMTSQVNVSDTLNLDGGSLTLNTGANLTINTNAMIVRNDGTLATTGGVFNSGGTYHVRYIGGAKTTGIEINSINLQNLEITLDDNSTALTLASNMQINGNLDLNTGILNVGANDLEIYGNIDIQPGGAALTTTAASNISIETDDALTSGLTFTTGSSVNQFVIDYSGTSGSVQLDSPLDIAGELHLHEGTLSIESGATLTMNSGSVIMVMNGEMEANGGMFDGTASYDVEYNGDSTVTTGLEVTGSGLNDLEVDIDQGQVVMDGDITVGGALELYSGKLNLNANDLILNGSIEQDEDSPIIGEENSDLQLNFTGTSNDTIYFDDAYPDLEQFVVNITGGGDIVLGSGLHIHDELTMTSGSIILTDEYLVIEEGADITGYSDTRYIETPANGKLQMHVAVSSPYVVFPVGTETNYSPASIQQASGATSGNFMVKAFDGVFAEGTEDAGYNVASITSVVNRTWLIYSDATTVDANLKLGWMLGSEVNGFDRTDAYISHYTSGNWDDYASSSAVTGANSTYEISRTGVSDLSPFSVADMSAELIVDEESVLSVNLYPNPCTDGLNISTNGDEFTYVVTDISGRTYDVRPIGVNKMDVSALSQGTYLLRMTNLKTNKTAVRKFVKK